MKKSLFYLLIQTMSLTIYSQSYDYELIEQRKELRSANISQEAVYVYHLKDDGTTDSALVFKSDYDEFGNAVEEYLPNPEHKKAEIIRYSNFYSANGVLLKQIEYTKDSVLIGTTEFVYDSAGNEIRLYKFNGSETEKYTEQMTYNKDQQITLLKKTQFSKNKVVLDLLIKYYYDQNRDLVKEVTIDRQGGILNSLSFEYDKSLNEKTVYSLNNGERKFEGLYFYNNAQQVISFNSSPTVYSHTSNENLPVADININEKLSSANVEYLDPLASKQNNGSNIITGTNNSAKGYSSDLKSNTTNISNFNLVKQNVYNADQTISETIIIINGKRVRAFKHYYTNIYNK